jgi:hypothetical protein
MDTSFDGRTDCGYEAVNGLPTIAGDKGEKRPLQEDRSSRSGLFLSLSRLFII